MNHSSLMLIVLVVFSASRSTAQGPKVDVPGAYGFNTSGSTVATPKIRGELATSDPGAIPEGTVSKGYERKSPDCGANALYVFLRIHKRTCSRSEIRGEVPITGKGASLLDLQRVARRFKLPCKIIQFSPANIASHLPSILLISQDGTTEGHFVVGVSSDGASIEYIDGTSGKQVTMKVGDFERCFTGYALVTEESPAVNLYLMIVVLELMGIGTAAAFLWRLSRNVKPTDNRLQADTAGNIAKS